MRSVTTILIFFLIFLTTGFVVPEPVELEIVQTALDIIQTRCDFLSRDQACYGHAHLVAEPRTGLDDFQFSEAGDIEDLARIQSLRLSGLDIELGTWGVTMMRLRANLSESQAENVTLIAFGDVELENAVLPSAEIQVTVHTNSYVNARLRPSTEAGVAGSLAPGTTIAAVERLADNSWLRVKLPGSDVTGWVRADLLVSDADVSVLNAADRAAPYYQPMQAFYFASQSNERSALPTNGLLIQTPEGVGEIQLLVNEINIQMGSTVFFEAQPGDTMRISTLEGHADVRANGVEHTAYAGTVITVPLNDDLKPVGSPSLPQPYDATMLSELPLILLDEEIEVTNPLTLIEIQQQIEADEIVIEEESAQSGEQNCPGNSCNAPDHNDSCPGNSCNAPGHNDNCPGNSCNAPGQNKDDKGNKGKKNN